LHAFQVKRTIAGVLLREANEAREKEDKEAEQQHLWRETQYLSRYLDRVPGDAEARSRHALLSARRPGSPAERRWAFSAVQGALDLSPEHPELRRTLVDLALATGRLEDARHQLERLADALPAAAGLQEELGRVEAAGKRFDKAAGRSRKAIEYDPKRAHCYLALAGLLRRHLQNAEEADRVIEEMVKANPKDGPALLGQARYLKQFKGDPASLDKAREALAKVLDEMAPKGPEALLLAAELELGGPEKVRAHLRRGRELHPKEARVDQLLVRVDQLLVRVDLARAKALSARGQDEEAQKLYEEMVPRAPAARLPAARLALDRSERLPEGQRERELGRAQALLEEAPAELQTSTEWRRLHGQLLVAQGRPDDARQEAEAWLQESPGTCPPGWRWPTSPPCARRPSRP
jgi:tetratricopeptide (TPR) repeat protein